MQAPSDHGSSKDAFSALCELIRLPADERSRFGADKDLISTSDVESNASAIVVRARANGLRVTRGTAPSLARSIERVSDALRIANVPEVYVIADPSPNASAVWAGSLNRSFLLIHSGLAQLVSGGELDFVLGHELGHLGLGHAIRRLQEASANVRNEAAHLRARLSERAAELSADRVGLIAARSLATAARVVMKVASGLDTEQLGVDTDAFLAQLESGALDSEWESSATHPGLPTRLWCLQRFAHSDVFANIAQCATRGVPLPVVDHEVDERLRTEAGDRLSAMELEHAERAVLWMAMSESCADRAYAVAWGAALSVRFGAEMHAQAHRFLKSFGVDELRNKMHTHVQQLHTCTAHTRSAARSEFDLLAHRAGRARQESWRCTEVERCYRLLVASLKV